MNLVISKCVTAVKVSNFTGHYFRNRSTLDMYIYIYIYICINREIGCESVNFVRTYIKVKDKVVPLQAWSGPEGSRKLRFPDFMTTA